MAFVDQDRSREKLLSGLASVALVGVVGYALVTGLAINVIRTMGHQVTIREWPAEAPPPPPPAHRMPEKAPPASHPVFIEKPLVPPLTPTQNTLETTVTLPPQNLSTIGPAGSTQSVPPLQPSKAVDARPKGNPAEWVTTDDYPAAALRNSQQGRTSFRLDIGADGRPTGCSIVQSSGSSDLDQAACRTLMHRAHFNAARDAAGMPVPSTYANNVLWRLPRD